MTCRWLDTRTDKCKLDGLWCDGVCDLWEPRGKKTERTRMNEAAD